DVALSEQQVAQQQIWAKRLAQALATHLQARLAEGLSPQMVGQMPPSQAGINPGQLVPGQFPTNSPSVENMQRLVASLDSTIGGTLQSLQQDLHSYQSALSQQISRMHNMEQQGEVILEALVNRLSVQLKDHITNVQTQFPGIQGYSAPLPIPGMGSEATVGHAAMAAPRSMPQPMPQSARPPVAPKVGSQLSTMRKGLILIILSTLALSFHNVMVSIIGFGAQFLGVLPLSPILPLNIPNSLLLLFFRMVVVLPLMAIVAQRLYPQVWRDLNQFLKKGQRLPILQVLSSGFFLFTSQVLIYKAIPDVGAGVAVTLLFMYPLFTVPLAWFLFGDRPSSLRVGVMFAITLGIFFVAWPRISNSLSSAELSAWGIVAAILSSIAFALYLISMQISFRKLHPVPVTLLQFTTILGLTGISVTVLLVCQRLGAPLFGLEIQEPSSLPALMIAVLLLGVLTLFGYLFNNYGVRLMGAAQASIVASSGPVVTAILAGFLTPGAQSALHIVQWGGVMMVTLGVVALSFERMTMQTKPAAKPKRLNA
ncbi:MAG: EamA family transporter, partial [Cyanobacteria bacterium J06639_16]